METEEATQETETRSLDFEMAVDLGSSEAAQLAERVQAGEMADQGQPIHQEGTVKDAEANKMIAEIYGQVMAARASMGTEYEHWRADEQEKDEVRDHVAPSIKELVPTSVLRQSKHITAVGTLTRLILSKKAQDPA